MIFKKAVMRGLGMLLLAATAAMAAPPDRTLLLPYFETGADYSSKSTLVSVTNPSDMPAAVTATVYSNWAIPVLTVPFHLGAHATQSMNLRDWFVYGALTADKRLCAD